MEMKFDKEGNITEVIQKESRIPESEITGLHKKTQENVVTLLDRKQEPVDWKKVNWPFIKLHGDHLLVQISEFEYHGKVEIPDAAKRDPTIGRVVMKGPDITDIEIGQKVLYSQFAGYLLKFEGIPKCRIMTRVEVLAEVKEKTPELIMEGA